MIKHVAFSLMAVSMMLGAPSVALAMGDGSIFGGGDDHSGSATHHGSAPEPVTILGLGLGAAAIGAARWAYRRNARKQ
jgi:hypothetical protein